jgi:hypothetical protein
MNFGHGFQSKSHRSAEKLDCEMTELYRPTIIISNRLLLCCPFPIPLMISNEVHLFRTLHTNSSRRETELLFGHLIVRHYPQPRLCDLIFVISETFVFTSAETVWAVLFPQKEYNQSQWRFATIGLMRQYHRQT